MTEFILKKTFQNLFYLSLFRWIAVFGVIGLVYPSIDDAVMILLGILAHIAVYP